MIKARIESQFDNTKEENGLRAGRSCIANIFTLKRLEKKWQEI